MSDQINDQAKSPDAQGSNEAQGANETQGSNESPAASGQKVTVRLKLDRPQKELVRLTDQRTIALLWGREISIENGRPLSFRRVKLWNRAGETLMKILKERDVSEQNPIVVDLNGVMKQDKREKKDVLEASYFTIVGEPQRTKKAEKDSARADAAAEAKPQPKTREKREFEHDMVVTGLLEERAGADGQRVAELAAMKAEEWAKASPADRESDAKMFKIVLAGPVSALQEQISKAAAWNGPYLDLEQPPVIRVKGTWQKLDSEAAAANAPYREFVFHAKSGNVLSGPNFSSDQAPVDKGRTARVASGPTL